MYLLVKFCVNYLRGAVFKIPILCNEFKNYNTIIRGYFLCKSNYTVRKFLAAFPDYGAGKCWCCHLIVRLALWCLIRSA